jgi:alcohol dehydrogenase class IV
VGFEFATATRIIFGPGSVGEVGAACAGFCPDGPVLVATGSSHDRALPVLVQLDERQIPYTLFPVTSEPTFDMIRDGLAKARRQGCRVVVGIGGGSVIDAGKAIAILLSNGGDPLEYAEVIGHGKTFRQRSVPYVAIPTTAGAGAEVTRNAVIGSPEHRVKVSLRSPLMLPWLAVVDPGITHSLPPDVTAATGVDALTQLIEPFVSKRANPFVDGLCREGMGRVARSLRRAYENGKDSTAREDMSLAALFGGLALANAGLGAVHGFAAPVGGAFSAPHGAVCASLLPHVIAANVRALQARDPGSSSLQRYEEIARILTGRRDAGALDVAAWTGDLCRSLSIRTLSAYGLSEADFPALMEKAEVASSMQGNPIRLTDTEMKAVLAKALAGGPP